MFEKKTIVALSLALLLGGCDDGQRDQETTATTSAKFVEDMTQSPQTQESGDTTFGMTAPLENTNGDIKSQSGRTGGATTPSTESTIGSTADDNDSA